MKFLPLILAVGFLPLTARATVRYVDINSPGPLAPYTNWTTAAVTIQDAIDTAEAGDLILVTNGVYRTGGRVVYGTLTNRIAVTKPLILQSINGPAVTVIEGYQVPGMNNGAGAVRCVYLTNATLLAGFTITNGATLSEGDSKQTYGGGVWSECHSSVATNCIIVNNFAFDRGGGAFRGTLSGCTILSNSVPQGSWWGFAGGAYSSILNDCTLRGNFAWYGGGASASSLTNCLLTGNWGWDAGGGAFDCALENCEVIRNFANGGGGTFSGTLNNCLIVSNSANYAGGTVSGTLNNCTITGNSASGTIGGVYCGFLNNCIVQYNSAPSEPEYLFDGEFPSLMNYCCTSSFPLEGIGNFTNAPLFLDLAGGNLRLHPNSPGINAGRNNYVSGPTDLDGSPRIVADTVDVGPYEFQKPTSVISYAWLQQFGLPVNGSVDYTDSDGEGRNNWQEWRADTVPTNALSALRMLSPTGNVSGVTVRWQSVSTRTYSLERATDLAAPPAFSTIATNLPGQIGTSSYTDTNFIGNATFYYRVGVQP